MCLPKFDNYQGIGVTIYFKSHTNFDVLNFFKKKFCLMPGLKFTLPDVTSFLPDNLRGLEINIFRSEAITSLAESTDADGIHQPLENL